MKHSETFDPVWDKMSVMMGKKQLKKEKRIEYRKTFKTGKKSSDKKHKKTPSRKVK